MARFKQFQPHKNNDNNHRWLVSYADYMTLMFALFVVMYAMATVQNKEFTAFSDTISNVFNHSLIEIEKPSHELFTENQAHTIAEPPNVAQPKLGDSTQVMDISYALSDVALKQQGQTLESLQQALKNVLSHEIEQGYVVIEQDMDWLTIELSSSLMFISGSGVPTTRAKKCIANLTSCLKYEPQFYSHSRLHRRFTD
jgi:chemotaxis protein MotB